MQNDFNVVVDLKRHLPQEPIHLHKGDKGIPRIQVNITSDGSDVTLTGLTATYSATVAGYAAVEDGSATISGSAVIIPVTENMTALAGLLLIDLKLTESSSKVVFTQTISAYVDPAVIDTGTYIDFSGITIAAALDSKLDKDDVDRLLLEKLLALPTVIRTGGFVNAVTDYGFTGDGTEEDTARLQRALDENFVVYVPAKKSINSEGETVNSPYYLYNKHVNKDSEGEYPKKSDGEALEAKDTACLTITKPVKLIGDGPEATKFSVGYPVGYLRFDTQGRILRVDKGGDGCVLESFGVEIDSNIYKEDGTEDQDDFKTGAVRGICIDNVSRVIIDKVRVYGVTGIGIRLNSKAQDCKLSNVVVQLCKHYGIENDADGNSFTNIQTSQNKKSGFLLQAGGCYVTNLKSWGNRENGVMLNHASYNILTNVEAQQNGMHGLYMKTSNREDGVGKTDVGARWECRSNVITNFQSMANNFISRQKINSRSLLGGCGFVISGTKNKIQGFDVCAKGRHSSNVFWCAVERRSLLIEDGRTVDNEIDIFIEDAPEGHLYDAYNLKNKENDFEPSVSNPYPSYVFEEYKPYEICAPIKMNAIRINGEMLEGEQHGNVFTDFTEAAPVRCSVETKVGGEREYTISFSGNANVKNDLDVMSKTSNATGGGTTSKLLFYKHGAESGPVNYVMDNAMGYAVLTKNIAPSNPVFPNKKHLWIEYECKSGRTDQSSAAFVCVTTERYGFNKKTVWKKVEGSLVETEAIIATIKFKRDGNTAKAGTQVFSTEEDLEKLKIGEGWEDLLNGNKVIKDEGAFYREYVVEPDGSNNFQYVDTSDSGTKYYSKNVENDMYRIGYPVLSSSNCNLNNFESATTNVEYHLDEELNPYTSAVKSTSVTESRWVRRRAVYVVNGGSSILRIHLCFANMNGHAGAGDKFSFRNFKYKLGSGTSAGAEEAAEEESAETERVGSDAVFEAETVRENHEKRMNSLSTMLEALEDQSALAVGKGSFGRVTDGGYSSNAEALESYFSTADSFYRYSKIGDRLILDFEIKLTDNIRSFVSNNIKLLFSGLTISSAAFDSKSYLFLTLHYGDGRNSDIDIFNTIKSDNQTSLDNKVELVRNSFPQTADYSGTDPDPLLTKEGDVIKGKILFIYKSEV